VLALDDQGDYLWHKSFGGFGSRSEENVRVGPRVNGRPKGFWRVRVGFDQGALHRRGREALVPQRHRHTKPLEVELDARREEAPAAWQYRYPRLQIQAFKFLRASFFLLCMM
jgi:hypothetical protein